MSVQLRMNDTPIKNQKDASQLQENHASDLKLPKKQAIKTKKKNLGTVLAVSVLIILIVVAFTLTFVERYHLRDSYILKETTTYEIPNSTRQISTTHVQLQHKPIIGQSTNIQGQLITLPSSDSSQSATPLIIAVNNKQAGISIKKLGDSNYFIQVDPIHFLTYYQKKDPVQAKRMHEYLHLTRNLADDSPFASEQLKQKIISTICQITKMDPHPEKTTLKQMQYHIATPTNKGFVLERKPPISSRLLEFVTNRQLYFYDMYLAYLMAARTEQMIDAAEQIQKIQEKQQQNKQKEQKNKQKEQQNEHKEQQNKQKQEKEKKKGQQPVTVVTVINIVNNTNVVINLNSSNNVVINNNNNKEVNIIKGNNEPVINNNTQVQNNNHSQVQSNTNNQVQSNINTNKRMLTKEKDPATDDTQTNSEVDEKNAISKAAFQYSTLCSDIDGAKYCPVGYFHDASNPFKLSAGQQQKGVTDLKVVKRIVIGSRILLNLDQLVKASQAVDRK